MKVAVFGASGLTGRMILPLLVQGGHSVQALARNPASVSQFDEAVSIVHGNARDMAAVVATIDGQDAVLSAFGQRSRRKDDVQEVFYRNVIAAMAHTGVHRFVALSALGVGDSRAQVPLVFRLIRNTVLKNVYDDKDRADALVAASDLDYTNVRPARLTDGPARGGVQASLNARGLSTSITRADVAAFLVDQLADTTWIRQSPLIGY
ncbi:MAG TPA: NAD(P)H-binding protein [Streptosporangiaceae bacterium]|nr:NAD(P)H-binding protein [Streptosporangiaceae bacterium]